LGDEQKVGGHDYYDRIAVRVLSESAFEITETLAGRPAARSRYTVSPDGGTLTVDFTDFRGEQPVTGVLTERRVGPAAFAGTHAASGQWRPVQVDLPDIARTVSLESTADGLKMAWNGLGVVAKFDGNHYPVLGDPGHTLVSLSRPAPNVIERTDRRRGKIQDFMQITVAGDGKILQVVDRDARNTRMSYTLDKQSCQGSTVDRACAVR
jgi:hypothetical protein